MITVHNLENSQSIRILWLLEELGADYYIQQYRRDSSSDMAPEEFKKLHIIGTAPAISDGEMTLPETNAIVDYILDKHPNTTLRPEPGTPQRTRYLYWLHATQGSFMPLMLDALIFKRMISKVPFLFRPVVRMVVNAVRGNYLWPRYERLLKHMESELSKSTWLSGEELTAADIVMGYCLEVAEVRTGISNEHPHIQAFLKRMRARPAYQRALEKNGAFKPFAD